ncbi:MAG TPA: tetratricopeptide repeat protein, partial [Vicinamibacterales bacterium]|nr:tetratricopeptide repeat protein [Vicinamibacterales bacterium]
LTPAVCVCVWSVLTLAGASASGACGGAAPPLPDIRLDDVAPEVATAVRAAESRVIADPHVAGNWLSLGMVCEANGLTADARHAYEQATTLAERNPRAWYRLAITRSRAGDLQGALAAVDRVIALDARYAPAHWHRGLWLLDTARDEEARDAFEHATAIDPASPGGWVGLARVALHRQDAGRAVEVLERFLSEHPGDRYALRLLGTAYQRLGRTNEAAHALAVGATGEPSWPDPWSDALAEHRVGFAQTLKAATQGVLAGEFDRAIPLFEKLLKERPGDLSLIHQLGLSYVAVGRASEGIALLQRALARDPDNLETHLRLASAYINSGNPQQALSHAERAVVLSPELGRAHEARGMALWRSGRPLDALAAFQQMVRFDPGNVSAQMWMGLILLEAGREAEALARFDRALRSDPTLADAYVGLGLVHLRRHRLAVAEEALTRAATLEPGNPRVRAAMAELERAQRGRPR